MSVLIPAPNADELFEGRTLLKRLRAVPCLVLKLFLAEPCELRSSASIALLLLFYSCSVGVPLFDVMFLLCYKLVVEPVFLECRRSFKCRPLPANGDVLSFVINFI